MVRTSVLRGVRALCAVVACCTGAVADAQALDPTTDIAVVEADDRTATFVGDDTYQLSLRQVARRFYATHDDGFDLLVVFPVFATTAQDGALYEAVSNDVRGLNVDQGGLGPEVFDLSEDYGSERLEGVVQFGDLRDLPDDPAAPFLGPWSALEVLAQEVAHRYGAFLWFSDDGSPSDRLLAHDLAHWSFFLDTGGGLLGGNRWLPGEGGGWVTGPPSKRYGPLDLYLLGLMTAEEVGPLRVLADAQVETRALDAHGRPYGRDSWPAEGVEARGAWTEISVDSIVAVEGAREPSGGAGDPVRRHAFVVVVRAGTGGASDDDVARLETFRRRWVGHYREVTGGRGRVLATLDGRDEPEPADSPDVVSGSSSGCAQGRGWVSLRAALRRRG